MNIFRWFCKLTVLGIVTFGLISCGSIKGSVKTGSREKSQIENITVQDYADRTEIVIEGSKSLSYTAFVLQDPLRYVVDLSDLSSGKYKDKIDVNRGAVSSIVPIENVQPFKAVRLEIGLLKQVEPAIKKEGFKLLIDVPKGEPAQAEASAGTAESGPRAEMAVTAAESATPKPVEKAEAPETPQPVQPEQPAPAQKEPESGPPHVVSNKVEAIQVNKTDQTVDVKISGDFSLPRTFKLKGNRLVVDIPGATHSVRPTVQNINLAPLLKIRVAQHPKPRKVRIVLDLSIDTDFITTKENNSFIIHLTRQMPAGAVPPLPAAQKEGEAPAEATPAGEKTAQKEEMQLKAEPAPPEPETPPSPPAAAKPLKKGNILFVEKSQIFRKKYVGEKIYLNFQDTEISNVLRIISEVSGFNFVIGDDVKGKVNLKLKNVPWDQALDLILKMNNLGQIREGNIIRVATLGTITKQQDDELKAKDSMSKTEDLVTQVIHINYAKAGEIMDPLKKNMSARGEITTDARTNSLIIKDVEKNANQVVDLIKTLDTPTPQVLIEARIVQVNPTFTRSLGVQWGVKSTTTDGVNTFGLTTGITGPFNAQTPDFAVNLPAASPLGGVGFSFGRLTGNPINLDLRLSAGESREMAKIISTPKISVLDNMEAKIEQGESIPFATTSLQGTQTTFVDANLTLMVTPHVTADGSIIMKIKTAKNAPGATRQGASGPSILKKEATTNVLVKDGDTAVIGGIYETSKTDSTAGVPILSQIPILGWLFKNNQKHDDTTELLVFLTPKILK